MYYKKLIGDNIYLAPLCLDDYPSYTEWVNDLEVGFGLPFPAMMINESSEKVALERLSSSGYHFAIVDAKTDTLIGNIGFAKLDSMNRIATVGIFIGNKDYWNKGYGTEALSLLLDYGFNVLNLNAINLSVYAYNLPAIRCYEKLGFKEAGRLREAKIIAGEAFDEIFMDILAREFESPYIKPLMSKRFAPTSL